MTGADLSSDLYVVSSSKTYSRDHYMYDKGSNRDTNERSTNYKSSNRHPYENSKYDKSSYRDQYDAKSQDYSKYSRERPYKRKYDESYSSNRNGKQKKPTKAVDKICFLHPDGDHTYRDCPEHNSRGCNECFGGRPFHKKKCSRFHENQKYLGKKIRADPPAYIPPADTVVLDIADQPVVERPDFEAADSFLQGFLGQ